MKYEEYKTIINDVIKSEKLDQLVTVLDSIKEDLTTRDNYAKLNSEQETKIRELQDTNMKLFLAQTSASPVKEEPEEVTGEEAVTEFINKILKGDK